METIINTIERAILQKQDEIKYNQMDINRIQQTINNAANDIYMLQAELKSLRRMINEQLRSNPGLTPPKSF